VGKPPTFRVAERIRFDGHVEAGVELARGILGRLRFSRDDSDQVEALVANHMRFADVARMRESTLKRFCACRGSKNTSNCTGWTCFQQPAPGELQSGEAQAGELPEERLKPPPLVTGATLIAAGYQPGPLFAQILTAVEDAQLEGAIGTEEEAMELVRREFPLRRRVQIRLRGIVQGVGFRPFVHNLANELKLGGYVLNSSAGLVAEVEGDPDAVERFRQKVAEQPPPLAWVQESEYTELDALGEESFAIRPSAAVTGEFALISPDVATCAECRADVADPSNRALAIRLPTARTAVHGTPSSGTFPTTAPRPPWRGSPCARPARRNTRTRATGGSMPSRMPAPCADRLCRRRWMKRGAAWPWARSSPSKAWAASTWRATRATRPR